jgi:hypothetical protein
MSFDNTHLYMYKERGDYLVKQIPHLIQFVEDVKGDETMGIYKVTLTFDTDVLHFFHAGINYTQKVYGI